MSRSKKLEPISLDWSRLLGFEQVVRKLGDAPTTLRDTCLTKVGGKPSRSRIPSWGGGARSSIRPELKIRHCPRGARAPSSRAPSGRLGDSIAACASGSRRACYLVSEAAGSRSPLTIQFAARGLWRTAAAGPVPPLAFGAYFELVLALESGDREGARELLRGDRGRA